MVVRKFGSWISTSPWKAQFLFLMCRCHAVEKMTRNSNAHMRDGFVLAESDLVDFLSGSTDSAINFSGSADLHTPIHPPPYECCTAVTITLSGHLFSVCYVDHFPKPMRKLHTITTGPYIIFSCTMSKV